MKSKVFFIHTIPSLIPMFNDLCKELLLPDVEVVHIADEMLAKIVIAQGRLSPFIYRRTSEHVVAAAQAGATLVQATCSSISPCIDASKAFVDIPVLKIDEPMARKAIQLGNRIGITATALTTLGPTSELVQSIALECARKVEISSVLCVGAYDALMGGNIELHDQIVLKYLHELMSRVDVVLLAQASMARVVEQLPVDEQVIPILTSPRLAVTHIAEVLLDLSERVLDVAQNEG
jgi:Asp/Glu/hydantoin racemase